MKNNIYMHLKANCSRNSKWHWNFSRPSSFYAAVNEHLELPLLKDRQRFDTVSTSNLEVSVESLGIGPINFEIGESSPISFLDMVNLHLLIFEAWWILNEHAFYYFLCLKANLDLEKTNQLGESSPNFIFSVANLDSIILEKRWIDDESWPNDFVEKVKRAEDLRWVGSRCPLMHALSLIKTVNILFWSVTQEPPGLLKTLKLFLSSLNNLLWDAYIIFQQRCWYNSFEIEHKTC